MAFKTRLRQTPTLKSNSKQRAPKFQLQLIL